MLLLQYLLLYDNICLICVEAKEMSWSSSGSDLSLSKNEGKVLCFWVDGQISYAH